VASHISFLLQRSFRSVRPPLINIQRPRRHGNLFWSFAKIVYIELLSVAQQRAAQQRVAQQVSLATTSNNNYLSLIPAQRMCERHYSSA